MPEILEVEAYRQAAGRALGRRIESVDAPDPWYLKEGTSVAELTAALPDRVFVEARRVGKLLTLEVDDGRRLGLRFGMTGRLLVDGDAPIERLRYSSGRNDPAWDRFVVRFADSGTLRLRDPRRLGGVALDPDESRLGVDALSASRDEVAAALAASAAPLKARLLDQRRIAGLGNLLTDEILWRAALAPSRPAGSLDDAEIDRLHRTLRRVLVELGGRGGSHTGDLHEERHADGHCPLDGSRLRRERVGGRTTVWCPQHQT